MQFVYCYYYRKLHTQLHPIWNWWQYLYIMYTRYLCFPSHYFLLFSLRCAFFFARNSQTFHFTLCVFTAALLFAFWRMKQNNFPGKCRSIWRNCKLCSGSCEQFWSISLDREIASVPFSFAADIISYWRNWPCIFLTSEGSRTTSKCSSSLELWDWWKIVIMRLAMCFLFMRKKLTVFGSV